MGFHYILNPPRSTTHKAPYLHPRLDSILELCLTFSNAVRLECYLTAALKTKNRFSNKEAFSCCAAGIRPPPVPGLLKRWT